MPRLVRLAVFCLVFAGASAATAVPAQAQAVTRDQDLEARTVPNETGRRQRVLDFAIGITFP